jgi:hypothetical protein
MRRTIGAALAAALFAVPLSPAVAAKDAKSTKTGAYAQSSRTLYFRQTARATINVWLHSAKSK